MQKSDVLAKLEQFKGKPISVGLADEGAVLHAGIEGHWLFVDGDNLVEVRTNTESGTYGFSSVTQQQRPFVYTSVPFDTVNYIRSYIDNTDVDIKAIVSSLTVVGSKKTMDDVIKEMESNTIRKAHSPTGNLNDPHVAPGGSYGKFNGSYISTEADGIPQYVKDALLKNE